MRELLAQFAWPQGLPNYITLIRIAVIGPLIHFILNGCLSWTLFFFFIGVISDGVDGYLARRRKEESDLGRVLDPISDKFFMAAVVVSRITFLKFWLWPIFIVLAAEELLLLFMGGVGLFWRKRVNQKLGANPFGKVKFVAHALLGFFFLSFPRFWYQGLSWLTLTIAALTGIAMFLGARSILRHYQDQKELVEEIRPW